MESEISEYVKAQPEMIQGLKDMVKIQKDMMDLKDSRIAYLERLAHRELDMTAPPTGTEKSEHYKHLQRILDNIRKAKAEFNKIHTKLCMNESDRIICMDIFDGCVQCVEETQ